MAFDDLPPLPVAPPCASRVEPHEACPTCGIVCKRAGLPYAPGCSIAGDGRRWDCYEIWGRVLNLQEREQMLLWQQRVERGD